MQENFKKKNIKDIKIGLIKNLLKFDGVELVLVSEKFISVKKNNDVKWNSLKPSIISTINDYVEKNKKPILTKSDNNKSEVIKKDDSVVDEIKKILDSKIRPAVEKMEGILNLFLLRMALSKLSLEGVVLVALAP